MIAWLALVLASLALAIMLALVALAVYLWRGFAPTLGPLLSLLPMGVMLGASAGAGEMKADEMQADGVLGLTFGRSHLESCSIHRAGGYACDCQSPGPPHLTDSSGAGRA